MRYPHPKFVVATSLLVLLAACAGSVPNEKGLREEAARAAQQSARSAAQALASVDADIMQAKQTGLTFYAPRHSKLALDALETAKKMQRGNIAERAQLEIILTAETALKRARDVQKNVRATLAPALKAHGELTLIHTHQSLPKLYLNNLAQLSDLIDDVEAGKLSDASSDVPDYLKQTAQLEIDTHLHQQLQRALDGIEQADDLDSDELAPQSLLSTQQAVQKAQTVIAQSPRDFALINQVGFVAWQQAQHLLALCQQIKQLQTQLKIEKVEGAAIEKLLLLFETQLGESFNAMTLPAPKQLDSSAQSQQLTAAIKLLKDNQPLSYTAPDHIDLRYPSDAVVIENVLPPDYPTWLEGSTLNVPTNTAAAPVVINAPATVETLAAPETKAMELPAAPTTNTDEEELQKAIANEAELKPVTEGEKK